MKWQEFQNLFETSAGWSAAQFAPGWLARKFSIGENAVSAEVSCFYHAAEFFTKIGRNAVAGMKMFLGRDELSFGLKYYEVGVEILCDPPLVRVASCKLRRTFDHPSHDIRKRESAAAGLGPHHGQRQRETRYSAPGCPKAPFAQVLHLAGTRRMIRRHQIDHSFS